MQEQRLGGGKSILASATELLTRLLFEDCGVFFLKIEGGRLWGVVGVDGEKKKASEKLFNYKHGLPSPFQLHNQA